MVILLGLSVNIKDETKYGLQYDEFIEIKKKEKKADDFFFHFHLSYFNELNERKRGYDYCNP